MAKRHVDLKEKVGADPEQVPLLKKNPDQVFWRNKTDRGHTIIFTAWPFVEPFQNIEVPAKGNSKTFTVYKGAANGAYGYAIVPSINPPSGPPGDPSVLVGD